MKPLTAIALFGLLVGLSLGCGKKTPTESGDPAKPPDTKNSDNSTTPVAKAETAEEALKALDGNWRVISIKNLPVGKVEEYLREVTGQIQGKVLELNKGIGYLDRAEVRLDPTKSPKQFDLISLDKTGKPRTIKFFTLDGPNDGKEQERPVPTVLGIYNLKGDQLTIALSDREGYRPTEFKPTVMEDTGPFIAPGKRGPTSVVIVELTRAKAGSPPHPEPFELPPERKIAKEIASVVNPFLTAFRAKDVDAAMKDAALPFVIGYELAPKTVAKADDLKAELKSQMEAVKDWAEFPTKMDGAETFERLRIDTSRPDQKGFEPFIAAASRQGYVVDLVTEKPQGRFHSPMRVYVKYVDGKARVVGFSKNTKD